MLGCHQPALSASIADPIYLQELSVSDSRRDIAVQSYVLLASILIFGAATVFQSHFPSYQDLDGHLT